MHEYKYVCAIVIMGLPNETENHFYIPLVSKNDKKKVDQIYDSDRFYKKFYTIDEFYNLGIKLTLLRTSFVHFSVSIDDHISALAYETFLRIHDANSLIINDIQMHDKDSDGTAVAMSVPYPEYRDNDILSMEPRDSRMTIYQYKEYDNFSQLLDEYETYDRNTKGYIKKLDQFIKTNDDIMNAPRKVDLDFVAIGAKRYLNNLTIPPYDVIMSVK